jgi:hypothetical protein
MESTEVGNLSLSGHRLWFKEEMESDKRHNNNNNNNNNNAANMLSRLIYTGVAQQF